MTRLAAASVQMKDALEAVSHLQLCDPGIIQGASVRVHMFSAIHTFEVDAHRLQRSSAREVWSGSEGPQEPTESHLTTNEPRRDTFAAFVGLFRWKMNAGLFG